MKINSKTYVLYLMLAYISISCTESNPNTDSFAASNAFADSVITQLSLEEKVALLHGMGGGNSEFGDLDIQFFGVKGNKDKGIPPLYMGHGITGVRSGRDTSIHATYFTTPIAIGCSWDTELYAQVGEAVAKEMRALGQDLNLGPTLNVIRHPLGGRNWESYSEDPYLISQLIVPYVKAMQSNGIICGPKHFVANNQETNRFDINNEVDERTLREIYLPGFKAAVKEGGALNIMGAYNRVNGEYMCHNKYLLDDVLRGEWGFEGFVLSDFAFGVKNTADAVNARMNVEMHRPKFYGDSLIVEIEKGNIQESQIDLLLKDVLKVMHFTGVFDRERYENQEVLHSEEHIELAYEVAKKTPVLLKNKNATLPVDVNTLNSIAVIGPNAKRFPSVSESHKKYAYYLQGGGSGRTYYYHNTVVEPLVGLSNTLTEQTQITYTQGCKTPNQFSKNKPSELDDEETNLIEEAVSAAKGAEAAIVYVGLSGFNESEGWDRSSANLPGQQEKLIREVAKVNSNTTVVLISGSYVDVSSWIEDVEALLFVPYCGEQIGNGIADIVTGKVNPSGRLSFSWPFNIEGYPASTLFTGGAYSEEQKSNIYSEGVFIGYRWFEKEEIEVLYPFGYGLSYTTFNYKNLKVIQESNIPTQVTLQVENIGSADGEELIQLYVKDFEASLPRPEKELKGFVKVNLAAGETKEVNILLPENAFSFYDVTTKQWIMEAGDFEIQVGSNSRNIALKQGININP